MGSNTTTTIHNTPSRQYEWGDLRMTYFPLFQTSFSKVFRSFPLVANVGCVRTIDRRDVNLRKLTIIFIYQPHTYLVPITILLVARIVKLLPVLLQPQPMIWSSSFKLQNDKFSSQNGSFAKKDSFDTAASFDPWDCDSEVSAMMEVETKSSKSSHSVLDCHLTLNLRGSARGIGTSLRNIGGPFCRSNSMAKLSRWLLVLPSSGFSSSE